MSKNPRRPLAEAERAANEFIARFVRGRFEVAGSIRRGCSEVGDIDIVVGEPLAGIRARFDSDIADVQGGDARLDATFRGFRFNVCFAADDEWGAILLYLTGPSGYGIGLRCRAAKTCAKCRKVQKEHRGERHDFEGGLKLNQHGLWRGEERIASCTEEEIYEALGKHWKEPALRGE